MSPVYEREKIDWNRNWRTISTLAVLGMFLGPCIGIIAPTITSARAKSKTAQLRVDFSMIEVAISKYHSDTGVLPSTLKDLEIRKNVQNWKGPYILPEEVIDPWNNSFILKRLGTTGKPYELISFGKDGKPGGTGINQDFSNLKPANIPPDTNDFAFIIFLWVVAFLWLASVAICLVNSVRWVVEKVEKRWKEKSLGNGSKPDKNPPNPAP